jgi:molybdopterin-containing oxidoreductase family iron-sulfur binding subunit
MSAFMNSSHDAKGKNYWRSLQELADTDEFRAQLENEFPGGIEAPVDGITRRRFLQVMSASIALTTLAGCRYPSEEILPFAERPEGMTPGTPLKFATTMELGPVALGVVATSYDGRPIKVDGNPYFPLAEGATSAFAQASVLDLYDPDRSQSVIRRPGTGQAKSDWEAFGKFARSHFAGNLSGVAILTEITTSPSHWGLFGQAMQRGAQGYFWEPVCRVNEVMGAHQAFGTAAKVQLDLDQAKVIVDFEANLLQDHPTALKNNRQFAAGRKPDHGHMNRLYVYENSFTTTGGMADHRFPTASSEIGSAVWALAAELVMGEGLALPYGAGLDRAQLAQWRGHAAGGEHIAAVAKDLMANQGHSVLLAGLGQPAEVHHLIHVLNNALGNSGHAISYVPMEMPGLGNLKDLTDHLNSGRIHTLLILGGNPVYDAPVDLKFDQAMMKAKNRIHLAHNDNATSRKCSWHLPRAHYLESWGDAKAWDNTRLSVQPLIAPLFDAKTATEVMSLILEETPRTSYQIARDTFAGGQAPENDKGFEKRWRNFIHDGFLKDSGLKHGQKLALAGNPVQAPRKGKALAADHLEVSFALDQSVFDGRFANNAWLQEMPDFMTKLTWDNAALVSPAAAAELAVKQGEMVNLEMGGHSLTLPVYIMPGQARYSVSVALGYGRDDAGRVADGAGFNANLLRTWDTRDFGTGARLTGTGKSYKLATTQDHHAIDASGAAAIQDRVPQLVREGTLEDYNQSPDFVDHLGIHHPPLESLWKEKEYTGYKWGMAIDLNVCNGCNACVVGCQAENNVAVVGKDEVSRGREMSWIRLDRYFLGDMDNPTVSQQPVGCVQCEMAPCEQVCPVAATVHTDEGLNAMVYNRCVGTRYCSNNCPYKVRRFNWFNNFEDLTNTERLVLNPDVTVRARGVMEKCTYCNQRIEGARIQARVEGRKIQDGDIVPACAQTCPVDAITFGDLNDPHSKVSQLREDSRSYDLLGYLNIKPRTFYMARLRNPNPEISPATMHEGGHGGGHGGGHDEGHGNEHGNEHGESHEGHSHG